MFDRAEKGVEQRRCVGLADANRELAEWNEAIVVVKKVREGWADEVDGMDSVEAERFYLALALRRS